MGLGKSQLRVCDSNYAIHFTALQSMRGPGNAGNERTGEFKAEIKWWN